MTPKFKSWWNGKQVPVDPDEPETMGGLGVLHETVTIRHWTSTVAHCVVNFYLTHWKWVWPTCIAALIAWGKLG